jgi:hypothetical protein
MIRTTPINRKLQIGGLALVAAGTMAFSATAAEAAPSKVEGPQATAAKAAHGKKNSSSKKRKRCKRPKVAVRKNGRIVRCVRPKPKPAAPKVAPAPKAETPSAADPAPTGTSTTPSEAKPTDQQASQLSSQADQLGPVVIGGSFEYTNSTPESSPPVDVNIAPRYLPQGCYGAYRASWGWYQYCDWSIVKWGDTPVGWYREWYYWTGSSWQYYANRYY